MTVILNEEQKKAVKKFSNKNLKRLMSSTTLAVIGVAALSASPAFAVDPNETPTGEHVVGGDADFDRPDDSTLNIYQNTDRLVIDWDTFNIGEDATTEFFQPGSNSLAVNRVTGDGQDPTQILGNLKANGRVMVLDRNGVFFGANARIDVGGIVASTGDVDTAAVMSGANQIEITNFGDASVINHGTINVADAGLAAFVAPHAANHGVINARMGRVGLAAGGSAVTLDLYGDQLLEITVPDDKANILVENTGLINAESGVVSLTAQAAKDVVDEVINMSGIIQVSSVTQQGGKIILSGGDQGKVSVTGTLDATGTTGGHIEVTGEFVSAEGDAVIDASGEYAGGTILFGGDFQGGGDLPTSTYAYVGEDAVLKADATVDGDGGTVILWGDDVAGFYGHISALGAGNGEGGFVETSSAGVLDARGTVHAGEWLLDPRNLMVVSSSSNSSVNIDFGDPTTIFSDSGFTSFVSDDVIEDALNNGTDVTLQTTDGGSGLGGDIIINAQIDAWINKTDDTVAVLTLLAHDDIILNEDIIAHDGTLHVVMNAGAFGDRLGLQQIIFNNDVVTNGGSFTAYAERVVFDDGLGSNVDSLITNGGNVNIYTDSLILGDNGLSTGNVLIDAGTGTISIDRLTKGTTNIGGSTLFGLNISQAEVNAMRAGNLAFGGDNTFTLNVVSLNTTIATMGNVDFTATGDDFSVVHFYGTNTFNSISATANDRVKIFDGGSVNLVDASGELNFTSNGLGFFGEIEIDGDIDTNGGNANFTVHNGGTFEIDGSADQIITDGGHVVITADEVDINTSDPSFAAIDAGTGTVTFLRDSEGAYSLGDTDTGGTHLSQDELANISAGELIIGNTNAAENNITSITVSNIDLTSFTISGDLNLNAYNGLANVDFQGTNILNGLDVDASGLITVVNGLIDTNGGDIDFDAGTGIEVKSGATVNSESGNIDFYADGDNWKQGTIVAGSVISEGGDISLRNESGNIVVTNTGVVDASVDGDTNGDVNFISNNSDIQLQGNSFVEGRTVYFEGGQVTQTAGGEIHARTLTGSLKKFARFLGTGNKINRLGNFEVGTNPGYNDAEGFTLVNDRNLRIVGDVTTTGGNIDIDVNGNVRFGGNGTVNANGGNIDIFQTGIFINDHEDNVITTGEGTITLVQNEGGLIQDVVDAIDNSGNGLNTITVNEGMYVETVTIAENNFLVKGANFGLAGDDATRGTETNVDGGFVISGNDVTLDGFEIVGGTSGVEVNGGDNAAIQNNVISGGTDNGVYIHNGAGNALVLNNAISDTGNGVWVNGSNGAVIQGNVISDLSENGILIENSDDVVIGQYDNKKLAAADQGNEISNVRTGIQILNGSDDITVIGNDISNVNGGNTLGDGIILRDSTGALIQDNTIKNVGDEGIFASGNLDGLRIIGNSIDTTGLNTGNSGSAIEVLNASGSVEISSNVIQNAGYHGIWIKTPNANSSFIVDNNKIFSSDEAGIVVDGNATSVSGNLVIDSGSDGIVVSNSDTVTVEDNTVNGANGSGLVIIGGSDVDVLNNNIYNVTVNGIHASGVSDLDIFGNDIDGDYFRPGNNQGAVGILVENSSDVEIGNNGAGFDQTNTIDDFEYGIKVVGGSDVEIDDNFITDVEYGIYASGVSELNIEDNEIDGRYFKPGQGTVGIYVEDSTNARIGGFGDGNNVEDFATGIQVVDSTSADIEYNTVTEAGIGILVTGSAFADIEDNLINGTSDDAIRVEGSIFADINDNDIFFADGDGISVKSSFGVNIEGNTMFVIGDDGIDVEDSNGAYIYDNFMRFVTNNGIELERSNFSLIDDNDLRFVDGNGIELTESSVVIVSRNAIEDVYGNGIEVNGGTLIAVINNDIEDTGENGIYVNGASNFLVFDNTVIDSGTNGILVTGSNGFDIDDNTVTGSGTNGILVTTSDEFDITDNTVTSSVNDGIRIFSSNDFGIAGNTVDLSGDEGIQVTFSDGFSINGNTVTNSTNDGIEVSNSSNFDITLNKVLGNGTEGIEVRNSNSFDITDNTVTDNSGDGIRVVGSEVFDIVGNIIDLSGDEGIDIENSNDFLIDDNTVTNSTNDGIEISDSTVFDVIGNEITGSGTEAIEIVGSSGFLVSDNTIDTAVTGISIRSSNNGTVELNTITNVDTGIELLASSSVTVDTNTITGALLSGVFASQSSDLTLTGNILDANTVAISFVDVTDSSIEENQITNSVTTGIQLENVDAVDVLFNNVTGSGEYGLFAGGPDNGLIVLSGNTFTDNPVSARFESGVIDMTGETNSFIGGDVGLQFVPFENPDGTFADMSLVGLTIGSSFFSGQSTFFVELDNGAFFAPGSPTIISALDATFETPFGTVQPGSQLPLGSLELNFLEDFFFHNFDDATLGLFFYGQPDLSEEDFLRQFAAFAAPAGGVNVTVAALPNVDAAQAFANLAPQAGDSANDGDTTEIASVDDLASIEPAAGGEETFCWGDAVASAGAGSTTNFSFGGSGLDTFSEAGGCQTGAF